MIKKCQLFEIEQIHSIIIDASIAYKNVIPKDCWHEPYMTLKELKNEISKGVNFYGYYKKSNLIGVMGIQNVKDVTLIRHAYVLTKERQKGIGTKLLNHLKKLADRPVLIGTWKAAEWAITFYNKNCFALVTEKEKNILLKKYWTISKRQIEESVVLADFLKK